MNIQLQITNFNKTHLQSKAIPFAATLSKVSLLLKKYRTKANKGFWNYTKSTGKADISSYEGLL